jgi:hypothetical protein
MKFKYIQDMNQRLGWGVLKGTRPIELNSLVVTVEKSVLTANYGRWEHRDHWFIV